MSKPPAFQFYADDFLAGVADMTQAEVGSYILLLCNQWSRGEIPTDKARMELIAKGDVTDHVLAKFPSGKNKRMEIERVKQAEYREKQSNKGKASAIARFNRGSTAVEPEGQPKVNSPSPSPSPSPLSKNISFDAVRLANRIICNQDVWQYDNCKVVSDDLKTKPLASVIEPMLADGKSEAEIIRAWCKAVYIAHGATVDGLAKNPVAYAITAFKEEATK